MNDKEYKSIRLGFKFPYQVGQYDQPNRFYHNIDHVHEIIDNGYGDWETMFFAVFHDLVYDQRKSDNEDKSIEILKDFELSDRFENLDPNIKDVVIPLIEYTKHDYESYKDVPPEMWKYVKLDLLCFLDLEYDIIGSEMKIFKEYQHHDFSKYQSGRIKLLEKFKTKLDGLETNIDLRIRFLETFKPKIGLFVGSFNPFHKGHQNILEKAERIFDKVIVGVGVNGSKTPQASRHRLDLDKKLHYRQVIKYEGTLVDYMAGLPYDVTLIRGLRTGNDFGYEYNLANVLRDMNGNPIDMCYIACDREYTHVSSTAVRELNKIGMGELYE